jgi:hypothetical protein
MKNDERIQAALDHAAQLPCLLCGGKSEWAGAWVPPADYDIVFEQQSPDERTSFGYALCATCRKADDVNDRVTAKLVQKWGGKLND